MNKFLTNLRRQAEENPVIAIGVGAAAVTAVTKLVHVTAESRNSKTWAKEVDRRRMTSPRR